MKAWTRILNPANVPCNGRLLRPLFCKVEITEDGKLSITGVIDPWESGNAGGGCGQINMEFSHRKPEDNDRRTSKPIAPEEMVFTEGWDREKWLDFLDVWEQWHLNDMKPNCQHQQGPEWQTSKPITLYYFRTKKHVQEAISAFKKRAQAALESGETVTPLSEETRLACLPDKITLATPDLPAHLAADYEANGPQYTGDHYNKPSEEKTAGWVHPEEHPEGLLCKPCPVCGYKYGSEWRKEKLPAKVVAFLKSLPETTVTPAWV